MKAYAVEQIRQLEKLAIGTTEVSESTLMENAGRAAFECLQLYWPESKRILVLCGSGNNGGDGYVLARWAKEAGLDVRVRYVGDLERLSSVAKHAYDQCLQVGLDLSPYSPDEPLEAQLVVDALLGIGIKGEVKDVYRTLIEHVNQTELPVLSLDVPSGIDADTGAVLGSAILADVTITFIALKQGLLTGDAVTYCGELTCDTLGVTSAQFAKVDPSVDLLEDTLLSTYLPPRPRNSHKGDYGHVLVLGGNHGMGGAVRMASEAAARTGAGLVSAVMQSEYIGATVAIRPELMCHAVFSPEDLQPLLDKASVLVIGAGLGQDQWAHMLLDGALKTSLPMVVDADALRLLREKKIRRENWILTPHPGEAAVLLGCHTSDIQGYPSDLKELGRRRSHETPQHSGCYVRMASGSENTPRTSKVMGIDRFSAAKAIADQYGGVVVLKGAGTVVYSQGNGMAICMAGNPGMATGGMGDVLGGIIGGLLAQGVPLREAANLGVWIHATAGDNVAFRQGERGMLATDLMLEIVALMNDS